MFARSICYILLVPFTLFDPVILIVAMAKKVWNALIFPSKRLYIQYKVKFQPRRFKSPRKLFLYFLEEPLQLWWCCLKLVLWDSLPRETRSRMADPPVGVGDPLEWAGGLRHTPWHYLSCPLLQGMQNWNWLKQLWLTTQRITNCCWCRSLLLPLFCLKFRRTFVVTLDFLWWFLPFVLLWWRMPPLWIWIVMRWMCLTRIAQEDGKVHKSHAIHWFNEEARLFAGFPAFHKLTEGWEKESLLCGFEVSLCSVHFHFSWSEVTRAVLD